MTKKQKVKRITQKKLSLPEKRERNLKVYMWALPLLAFIIKMITISNTEAGVWLGADGENYLKGVDALLNNGIFSDAEILNYWPAGYPMLIAGLAKIWFSKTFYLISIIQSLFFAFASYYLAEKMRSNGLKFLAFTVLLFISFNPSLSLSTIAIGYEAPVAAAFMMIIGLLLTNGIREITSKKITYIFLWFTFLVFLQPRYLIVGLFFIAVLLVVYTSKENKLKFATISIIVLLISPVILISRNYVATGQAVISTNLGVTMRIGAGPNTTGGYTHTGDYVPCAAGSDSQLVACITKWYLTNPIDSVRLAYFKSIYFWSPWSGPLANGTMARNPSLKISPTQNIRSTEAGNNLVQGLFGKIISSLWIMGQLLLLFLGLIWLRKLGGVPRDISTFIGLPVLLSWLVSIATIGDHRFRLPTMGLSIFLQVAGLFAIRYRMRTNKIKWFG